MRNSAQDAEFTRLLRERDRITARLRELGLRIPDRPGAVIAAEWPAGGSRQLEWHKGRHAWEQHDGYPRHQHSINGVLTIVPNDTRPHFAHGPEFKESRS
jgi:hypothetical protein